MCLRPIEEILGVEYVPESFRAHVGILKALGTGMVYHVAVSYKEMGVNLSLQVRSEFEPERVRSVV